MQSENPNNKQGRQGSVISAVRWSGVVQVLGEGIRIIGAVILARLLLAEDFGLMALAIVVTGFIALFQYLGTGGIIVQKKELSDGLIGSLFIINLAFGSILVLCLQFTCSFLAELFNMPEAGQVIRVLSFSILITSFGIVPTSLLNKNLRFDLIARIKFTETIVYSGVSITLAYTGWNVWALVYASLAGSAVSIIYLWFVSDWRPRPDFRWSEIKNIYRFGLNLTGSNIVEYFARNVDRMIIGRWLGSSSLGHYSIAYRFCLFPLESIAPVLVRVLFPAFSRMQDDDVRLRNAFLRACGGLAFVLFPLLAGLLVLAGPFVNVILGPKWEQVIPLVMLLTAIGIIRAVAAPANDILLARGRSDLLFRILLVTAFALAIGMFASLKWGIIGVAAAYVIVSIPLAYVRVTTALRVAGIAFGAFLKNLFPYILSTTIMALSVYGCRLILERLAFANHTVLIICIGAGVIIYILMTLLLRPNALFDILKVIPLSENAEKLLLKKLSKNAG